MKWTGDCLFFGVLVAASVFIAFHAVHNPLRPPPEAIASRIANANLKQIGLALHAYHDAHKCFPPAYVADKDGKPMYSWRVLILPYLEESSRRKDRAELKFDFSKFWDSPENQGALSRMPHAYRRAFDDDRSVTTAYAAAFGPRCVFRGIEPVRIRDIKDGTTTTIIVGEVGGDGIPWTKPADVDVTKFPLVNDPNGFCSKRADGCRFLQSDGSTRFLSTDTAEETMRAFYTFNGGEKPPSD